jgi:2-keto-4-pentenoate hydratase/2-oxohepta-3-ene-1,7-dioic acid hydratase in catechol pathway
MKLVSYDAGDGMRAGVLEDDRVVDAWALLGEPHRGGLRELLAAGRVEELRGRLGDSGAPSHPLAAVALLAPIPDPEKIVCIGLNYAKHAAEGRMEAPPSPTFFAKYRNALAPPGATVPLPANSSKVDYEAEVAFVVGRRAKDVAEDEALDFVAGYTLLNDLSARDLQFSTPQWMPGKVFDGSAPCGPALVTPEEAGPTDEIEIRLTLNGEQMQGASTADLIFSIPALLSHLSSLMTLEPGDIVATGTPEGVGGAREPRVWLGAGDELVIESPTLGRLETRIA